MNSAHSYSEGAEVPEDKTDNELIAEFMGLKKDSVGLYKINDFPHIHATCLVGTEYLDFHKSWDWLVPVARKFTEKAKHTDMPHAIFMNVYTFSVCRPIAELYKNIITGIKWYNSKI